ncbi:MAG: hypothetical protein KKA28_06935 [Planctomycetes bacterium]|nr:hypothetical protein [Planctomycetota bacterium]MCG2683236.1 hypothetical protein [Planctomycetales bacterium]
MKEHFWKLFAVVALTAVLVCGVFGRDLRKALVGPDLREDSDNPFSQSSWELRGAKCTVRLKDGKFTSGFFSNANNDTIVLATVFKDDQGIVTKTSTVIIPWEHILYIEGSKETTE